MRYIAVEVQGIARPHRELLLSDGEVNPAAEDEHELFTWMLEELRAAISAR
jgi:hypothetical protein